MSVPFPFRVAAGVLATGLDRLRTLPGDLPGITVSLAGHALRASMRVRQEIEELASRGDEVLAPITERPQEHPAWARFDDEEEGDAAGVAGSGEPDGEAGSGDVAASGGPAGGAAGDEYDEPARPSARAGSAAPGLPIADYETLRIGQLRARLHTLDAASLRLLLGHEESHQARPVFLTALQNRLTTLQTAPVGERRR